MNMKWVDLPVGLFFTLCCGIAVRVLVLLERPTLSHTVTHLELFPQEVRGNGVIIKIPKKVTPYTRFLTPESLWGRGLSR